ncbi:fucose-specific lectin [Lindgomyces ingoldianus]|uniref:Fucose-specific lectin n=1 Tax=Lindgomyces ingoldianus TaxID=673940 RepID=A0ACB6QSM5_9PLEO|nr:fucose-specific lectin [Lindgomyces ingoldianus]KAF2469568.1 fucose-specific lectin [Lindgomyces ingoldianus]
MSTHWKSLGVKIHGPPVVVSGDDNRIDIFYQGSDMKIYHKWRVNNVWYPIGEPAVKRGDEAGNGISAVARGPRSFDIFARSQGTIWHLQCENDIWKSWESLEGNAVDKPVVVSWGTKRLDVFAVFADQNVWHRAWNGDEWQPWESIGGNVIGQPGVAAWGPNRLDVSVHGLDNQVHHKSWDGSNWIPSQTGFGPLSGKIKGNLLEIADMPGRLALYCLGFNSPHGVFTKTFGGGTWHPPSNTWIPLGGQCVDSGPHGVSAKEGLLDLVIRGPDNSIWHKGYNGVNWVPGGESWTSLGGSMSSPPVLSPNGSIRLEVFARGTNGDLMHYS